MKIIRFTDSQYQEEVERLVNRSNLDLATQDRTVREIIDAVKKISRDVHDGKLDVNQIDEEIISQALYTRGIPDPDLLIRTSGEKRISNFLLWQLSYAEFYFTEKYWPEFTVDELKKAMHEYKSRERRYGNLTVKS